MSGDFFLDWATLATSLFNAILLLWLGLVVLLNVERRTWGIWLAGGGLVCGAVFFLIHSIILGLGFALVAWSSNFWWYSGWIPVILAPFAWYVVMLWYTGYWEEAPNPVRQRHQFWLAVLFTMALVMVSTFIFANPLPSFGQLAHLKFNSDFSILGIPLLILFYPPFIIACIVLALEALFRPGPTLRAMGAIARRRARPWLIAASLVLLLVSLLVAFFVAWLALQAREYSPSLTLAWAVGWIDLVISGLIAISILFTGQAIVSYEVFTGKALARRGLRRFWRWTLALGAGYSLFFSLVLHLRLPSIYLLVLNTVLTVLLLGLLSRRSLRERVGIIAALRPFISIHPSGTSASHADIEPYTPEIGIAFRALCTQVLGTSSARLQPTKMLEDLFGQPLVYPAFEDAPVLDLERIFKEHNLTPEVLYLPLPPEASDRARWLVPLWNQQGLCGGLWLGEKQDQGLYSEEEIEVAGSAAARLVDLQISRAITQRLLALQRRQLAENQVLDRQARRVLHDEVLPRIHAVLLDFNAANLTENASKPIETLTQIHRQISDLLHDLPAPFAPEIARHGLVDALRNCVDQEYSGAFDEVEWTITPGFEARMGALTSLQTEVLYYAAREGIRNAARHARSIGDQALLRLKISLNWQQGAEINIEDNGVGMDRTENGQPGGHGLELHRTLLAVIGGNLGIETKAGSFTCLRLFLPAGVEQHDL